MLKKISFSGISFASIVFLLADLFLQSCAEERPVQPSYSTKEVRTVPSETIILTISSKDYISSDQMPGMVTMATFPVSSAKPKLRQHSIGATNGSKSNMIDYSVLFHTDHAGSNNYVVDASQLVFNQKKYVTVNRFRKAKLNIKQLDTGNTSALGSFGYYVYDSVSAPKDSIYVSGSFNIEK